MKIAIEWRDFGERIVAYCGDAPVGAVFPGIHRVRWRAWVTKNMNPVEQTAKDIPEAKAAVVKKFGEFLMLAKLKPTQPEGDARGETRPDWANRPACSFPEMAPAEALRDARDPHYAAPQPCADAYAVKQPVAGLAELLRAVKRCDSYANPDSGLSKLMAAYEDACSAPSTSRGGPNG